MSLRAITMPSHSQGVITCDNVSADMSAVAYLRVIEIDTVTSAAAIESVYGPR